MEIAIVEDEPKLAALLAEYLEKENYVCTIYADGSEALSALQDRMPDMILLDLMLPGTDGLTICRELRKHSAVPVIMLTARVEEIDRLLGLEIGADDYLCKPYSPREVVARVKALFRRSSGELVTSDDTTVLRIDEQRASVTIGNRVSQLTAVELGLLKAMVESPGRIFNRNQLMNRIYPDNRIVSDRTIDSHVKKLRHKLAALDPEQECIQSVYGIGYKYEPESIMPIG
ncbi:MAG: response regulator [Granulosicoccus sp.]